MGTDNIVFAVADKYLGAGIGQTLNAGAVVEIGSGYVITLIEQHFGNATHTTAANADKMNTADAAHFRGLEVRISAHSLPPDRPWPRVQRHRFWPVLGPA